MTPGDGTFDPRLEAYLDGQMSAEERAAYEAEVARSPDLQDRVGLQRRIDGSLGRAYSPATQAVPVEPARAPAPLRFPSLRRIVMYGLAAALVLSAVGVWARILLKPAPAIIATPGALVPPAEVYTRLVNAGFEPDYVCNEGPDFAKAIEDYFGRPLVLASSPASLDVLGWSYPKARDAAVSKKTLYLLARYEDKPVLVMMDLRRQEIPGRPRECMGDVNVFRREVGEFVLYEIGPFPEERIAPLLREPGGG